MLSLPRYKGLAPFREEDMADKGWEADARHWAGRVAREYRMLLLEEGKEKTREVVNDDGERVRKVVRKGMKRQKVMEE